MYASISATCSRRGSDSISISGISLFMPSTSLAAVKERGSNLAIDIEIRKFKDMNLTGGTVLEAFPSVGLVSTIASSYLISTLDLDQICALESEHFPPMSMVYATKPKFPARIYAREDLKLAVFISEFPPHTMLHRPLAKRLLSWTMDQGCRRILSLEGLPKPGRELEPA